MAIEKIKCLRIIGMIDNLYETVQVLGSTRSFHQDDPMNFYSNTKKFLPVQSVNPYEEITEKLQTALETGGIKCKKVDIGDCSFKEEEIKSLVEEKVEVLNGLMNKQFELEGKIEKCRRNIEQIGHFLDLDLEIDKVNNCRYIKANFGKLPKQSFEKLKMYSDNPFVIFFPCSNDEEYYWGMYMSPVTNSDDVDRIFSGLYFENCDVLDSNGTPEQYCKEQQALLLKLEDELKDIKKQFSDYVTKEKKNIDIYYSFLSYIRKDYELMSKAVYYNKSFILIGWVSADKAEAVVKKLKNIESVECTLSDGKNELRHSPPVKLKNNPLTRGFEFYTKMYGLPNYREFDPTTFIAITYTILFGIMFGDVGHGITVLLAGIFMKKKLKMPIGSILIPCGISGTIFGFVYGSVFGFENLLDPVYKALFGLNEKPISVMEPAATNMIIYMAVGIGILLVTIAIILNVIVSFKMNDIENAVFGNNGLCGLIFYVSVAAAIICQILLGIKVINPVYIIVLIVLPLILIFLKEPFGRLAQGKKKWQPEKWGEYCVQNFFELFEVLLSYVTNTMSFLRVGAFVLVHAGMMEVVFTLAGMASGVGYVAIVIIGNIFVIGLEALLVCIQVLRLEFYEMFGRFYRGDGRAYIPVGSAAE